MALLSKLEVIYAEIAVWYHTSREMNPDRLDADSPDSILELDHERWVKARLSLQNLQHLIDVSNQPEVSSGECKFRCVQAALQIIGKFCFHRPMARTILRREREDHSTIVLNIHQKQPLTSNDSTLHF